MRMPYQNQGTESGTKEDMELGNSGIKKGAPGTKSALKKSEDSERFSKQNEVLCVD